MIQHDRNDHVVGTQTHPAVETVETVYERGMFRGVMVRPALVCVIDSWP
jgi:hypothetical protein